MRELEMSPVVSCPSNTSIREVARLMSDQGVGCVVVLDAHGHLAGIVTDRDMTVRGFGGELGSDTAIDAVMTREVEWAGEDIDVFEAATRMVERGCRRLPLLDVDGQLTGIMTLDDLLPLFARQIDKIARTVGGESRAPTGPV
jgi:signal-transduction protein with cAMP-binding, CBS, and nucleotidyltransferase domain